MKKLLILSIAVLLIVVFVILMSWFAKPDLESNFKVKRFLENTLSTALISDSFMLRFKNPVLENRLSEFEYLVKNEKYELLRVQASRYSTTAGNSVELIKSGLSEDLSRSTLKLFKEHREVLSYLIENFPVHPPYKDMSWEHLKDAQNYLDIYISQLDNPR